MEMSLVWWLDWTDHKFYFMVLSSLLSTWVTRVGSNASKRDIPETVLQSWALLLVGHATTPSPKRPPGPEPPVEARVVQFLFERAMGGCWCPRCLLFFWLCAVSKRNQTRQYSANFISFQSFTAGGCILFVFVGLNFLSLKDFKSIRVAPHLI